MIPQGDEAPFTTDPFYGYGKQPMFGDFEAQRHWMEVTYNLPVKQWYFNNTDNDLLYWGLDYPPLTAYHSWLCGYVADKINSSWVELHASRGIEDDMHKLFMRYTVVVADVLVYMSAVLTYFFTCVGDKSHKSKLWHAFIALLYPGLILIDHGHFQYNCISLGFALWAVVALSHGYDVIGSMAFVFALNYKQMELFHAMPFFCYLLGLSFKGKENWFFKLVKICIAVCISFGICWYPFLEEKDQVLQVLNRVFPFNRGLFEDKVANFWCSISVVIKLKQMYDIPTILKICLCTTICCLLPSSFHLLLRPNIKTFKLALVNSSLVFFLFSYQVHEKSILIVALPCLLLLHESPYMCRWFLQISTFSMLPLLLKDGLVIPTFSLMGLYYFTTKITFAEDEVISLRKTNVFVDIMETLSMFGAAALSIASISVEPPPKYPDLWPVFVSLYSAGHFIVFLFYFHYWQFTSGEMSENVQYVSPSKKRRSVKVGYSQIEKKKQ